MNTHQARHVLVVEDSPTQAARLRHTLEPDGWEVRVVCSGREALDGIEKHPPDIVISEVMMPEMDGYTLCAEVRKRPELKDIPFILLTTLDNPTDMIQGLRCGVNNFIVKPYDEEPYDEEQLLSRLRYIVAYAELRRTTGFEIGLEVHFAGQKHFLTLERIQILDLLLSSFQTAVDKNQALEQLERTRQEQLRVKDRFLSHVSHELRTPLGAIDQFVTLLLDGRAGPISDEQREYLGIAHRNAGHLRDMIEDLQQATRAQSGKLTVEPCELPLLPVLGDAEETLRQTATEKGLTLKLEAAPGLPAVYADPQRVRQIVLNLVGNAIKFTPAGGTVTIAAVLRPGNEAFLQISVRDTGCGISAEDCERIFDKLYQAESTRGQNHKGLGLGLFISRDLVTHQGGRIWVESELERGTTFHFTLPLFAPDQVLRHAIQRHLDVAGEEQGKFCLFLFTLDTDVISKASPVADSGKGATLNDVWEALARKAEQMGFHETAFSGSEFIVMTAVPDHAMIAVQGKLGRLLKDVLFQTAPAAVAGFSCGVVTRTAETAGAAELLAAARDGQVHERERIAAKSILLVNDDSSVRRALRVGLEQMGMRRVGEASGGNEALGMLEEEVPDLMLIDLQMPGMNGYELVGRLKESRRTADIPVLMVSGYEVKSEEPRKRSPKTAILVLAKPLDCAALSRYVSYLL